MGSTVVHPLLLLLLLSVVTLAPVLARNHHSRQFDLYVAAGPDNWTRGANDTLVVFRVDLARKSVKLRWRVDLGSVGNEPHHLKLSRDQTHLVLCGLLSFASGLPSVYFFRTSPHHAPQLIKAETPPNSTAADIGLDLPDGGFLVSMMGGPGGGAGGQLVVYDAAMNYVRQFPPDAGDYFVKTGVGFNPHGVTRSDDGKYIFSSDFVEPITTVPAYGPVKRWGAIRMFNATTYEYIRKYVAPTDGPNQMGAMDVLWVNGRALTTCTATGKLYCADPKKTEPQVSYDFGDANAQPQLLVRTRSQKVVYVTCYGQDAVYKLDTRRPCKNKLIKKLQLPAGAGPHSLALSPDERVLIVTDYFLDEKNIGGVVHARGDMKVRFIDTRSMREIEGMQLDFSTLLNPNVVFRPHGAAVMKL